MATSGSRKRSVSPSDSGSGENLGKKPRTWRKCEWITEELEFQEWKKASRRANSIIWVHGPSGCGKTTLARFIHQQLNEEGRQAVMYSCDHHSTLGDFLLSVIRQLMDKPNWTTRHNNMFQQIPDDDSLEIKESSIDLGYLIWDTFLSLVRTGLEFDLIFDGIDESTRLLEFDLPAKLADELQQLGANWRLLLLSDTHADIGKSLGGCPKIGITNEKVHDDLERFIHTEIDQYEKLIPNKDAIIAFLAPLCNGIFSLARLWINELSMGTTVTEVFSSLSSSLYSPGSLNEAYKIFFERHPDNIGRPDLELRTFALRWLSVSVRPIQPIELANALAIDTNKFIYDIDVEISRVCYPLVKYNGKTLDGHNRLKLIHPSLLDFLLEGHPSSQLFVDEPGKAHGNIARTCLNYLSHTSFANTSTKSLEGGHDTKYPLLEYATLYWGHHVSKADKSDPTLASLINTFLDSPNAVVWLTELLPRYLPKSVLRPPPGRTERGARMFWIFQLKHMLASFLSGKQSSEYDKKISEFLRKTYENKLTASLGLARWAYLSESLELAQFYSWSKEPKTQTILQDTLEEASKLSDAGGKIIAWDAQQALADEYKYAGRYKEAQSLLETLLAREQEYRDLVLPDHADAKATRTVETRVMIAHDALGWTLMRLDDLENSAEHLSCALSISTKFYGSQSPMTLRPKVTLAKVLNKLGKAEEAEVLCKELYGQVKEHARNGKCIPRDSISQLNTLAAVFVQLKKWKEAVETWNVVVEDRRKQFGEDHPMTLWATMQLGKGKENNGEGEAALVLFEDLIPRQKKVLGEAHPDVKESMERLSALRIVMR